MVRDGDAVVFSTIDEGKLWRFDPASKAVTELRRYANRVNGLARGPGGELYGAQDYVQQLFYGAVLVIAVVISRLNQCC